MSVRYTATWYDVMQARQQDTHHTHRHVPARPALNSASHTGLPDGRGHGRITQKRQYKNQSGRDKTIFLLLKGILADFLVG